MRAQDTTCTLGRRIIMQVGLGPADDWRPLVESHNQVLYGRTRARLTSGSMLRVQVVYVPGGPLVSGEGLSGQLDLAITWTADDATVETHTVELPLEVSANTDHAALTGAGEAWGEARTLVRTITPPVDLTDDVEANRWTISPSVEIDAYTRGSVRIVDFIVFEVPFQVSMESDDAEWTSHVFATGEIGDSSGAASNRPRTRRSETDPDGNPRGGTLLTMDVAAQQRQRFGPYLLRWTNYQETLAAPAIGLDPSTGLEPLEVTGSSSELRCIFDITLTEHDPAREGLSVACGGYARPYRDSNGHVLGTEDAEAAIRVLFRVYGSVSAGTGRVLCKTAEDSWVEVTLTTSNGWHEGWGWMQVGLNPSDVTVAQVFVEGSATFSIEAFTLEHYRG